MKQSHKTRLCPAPSVRRLAIFLPWLALVAACGKEVPAPEPLRPVITQRVGTSADRAGESYSGEVRSRFETPLAFRIGGKVTARLVDSGAPVKAGDVLARIDPADTALSAQAAQAQLTLAEAEAQRFRELRRRNFVSQAALDAKETALQSARAQADLARNQSSYTTLRAESAGVVGLISAEVGQVVTAGQPVMRLMRADTLEVAIAIPESRIQGVRAGQPAEVGLWAAEQARYKALVREISPVADPVTRTYAARVAIPLPDEKLRLGMTADVHFAPGNTGEKLVVPLTAVFQKEGRPALWIVGEDQTLSLRPVEVAAYRETDAVLASGVRAGERIVVAGVHKLAVGEKIKIAESSRSTASSGSAQ